MKERIYELFKDYGALSVIKKVKQPRKKKITIYSYDFKVSNIMEGADNVTLMFLLVDQSDLFTLANFGLNDALNDEEDVLSQLNRANSQMLYGKFLVDDDNDVHWEYSFEPSKVTKEDILAIFQGFINGLAILLNWKEETIDGQ